MSSKSIVLYLADLTKGGTQRVAVNLAEYLHSRGHKVTLATTYQLENEYTHSEAIARVLTDAPADALGKGRIADFMTRLNCIKKAFTDVNADIVLSFIGKNNMMAILATMNTNIKCFVAVRGEPTEEYYSRALRLISKTLFAKADGVILQTRKSMEYFPKMVRRKCVVLKNPINPLFMADNDRSCVARTIVSVGRVDENKHQIMLINSFAGLAPDYPDWNMIIYGDGESRQKLIEVADKFNELIGPGRISLPGSVTDVRSHIRDAGVFVLPSKTEGMPNALIEAMSLGIPCISTDCPCGGPAELIEDGINGYLIPVDDEKALTDRLKLLMDNEQLRKDIGLRAGDIKKQLDPENVDPTWEDYLCAE